jgi:multiple sugar transport system ATP-binding protein
VLLGPTGAGKTTTLRLVAGLERPTRATSDRRARRDRATPAEARRGDGVPAVFALPAPDGARQPRLPAALAGGLARGRDRAPRAARWPRCCASTHKLDNKATALSGGEMQRVSIGRALVRGRAIYLMDEPLSSLDAKLRADLRVELKRIQPISGATLSMSPTTRSRR